MKLLVATTRTQGQATDDFTWTTEGELVHQGMTCDRPTPTCGCDRSMTGLDTHKATTTVRVLEFPGFTVAQLADRIKASLSAAGWQVDPTWDDTIAVEAAHLAKLADGLDLDRTYGVGPHLTLHPRDPAPPTATVTLTIDNTYQDGTSTITTVTTTIPLPPDPDDSQATDDWAEDWIFPWTGTGKTDGDAWYDVTITAATDPTLTGRTFAFGY